MRMKTTKPNRASASVKAMPRNMVVRTMPAASGWRAMAVMALPTTMPMPMPGPMAARAVADTATDGREAVEELAGICVCASTSAERHLRLLS